MTGVVLAIPVLADPCVGLHEPLRDEVAGAVTLSQHMALPGIEVVIPNASELAEPEPGALEIQSGGHADSDQGVAGVDPVLSQEDASEVFVGKSDAYQKHEFEARHENCSPESLQVPGKWGIHPRTKELIAIFPVYTMPALELWFKSEIGVTHRKDRMPKQVEVQKRLAIARRSSAAQAYAPQLSKPKPVSPSPAALVATAPASSPPALSDMLGMRRPIDCRPPKRAAPPLPARGRPSGSTSLSRWLKLKLPRLESGFKAGARLQPC